MNAFKKLLAFFQFFKWVFFVNIKIIGSFNRVKVIISEDLEDDNEEIKQER